MEQERKRELEREGVVGEKERLRGLKETGRRRLRVEERGGKGGGTFTHQQRGGLHK